MRIRPKQLLRTATLLLAVMLTAAALFYLAHEKDNKYTSQGPQPINGVWMLDNHTLERYPLLWPVLDWEIYRGKLLIPEDFVEKNQQPDELVFIGQYGGLEGKAALNRSPHGSATYRLNVTLPEEMRSYTLELPEIYSAYKLYINGLLFHEMGSPDADTYRPQTGITSVTVQAAGHMEILIAVTDYNHFYSGMVYPPAFGEPAAVAQMMNTRLTLRTLACAVALCVGLLYLLVGVISGIRQGKNGLGALPVLYFLLCLTFTLNICHPILKTLFWGGMFFYTLEFFSFCAMLLLVILILDRLTGMAPLWAKSFAALGIFACTCALVMPQIMGSNFHVMVAYSRLIGLYTWLCAVYLTGGAVLGVCRGKTGSPLILMGVVVFDVALVMDRIFPLFEPIRFGWFIEIAGGVLVACIGTALATDIASQLRLRQALEARGEMVSKMLEVQKSHYPALLQKEQETREARHDLRHHFLVLQELLAQKDMDGLARYLEECALKRTAPIPVSYCRHYVTDTLLRMYTRLAAEQETAFVVKAGAMPEVTSVDDGDLCVMLSNLLENALEASVGISPEERSVAVHIGHSHNRLIIAVENTFDGKPKMKNGNFLSRKAANRMGLGLASVKSIAGRYGGNASFTASGTLFRSEVILPDRPQKTNKEVG